MRLPRPFYSHSHPVSTGWTGAPLKSSKTVSTVFLVTPFGAVPLNARETVETVNCIFGAYLATRLKPCVNETVPQRCVSSANRLSTFLLIARRSSIQLVHNFLQNLLLPLARLLPQFVIFVAQANEGL
jgi:hypothetical protein